MLPLDKSRTTRQNCTMTEQGAASAAHTLYDVLKDFQPSLAALIALAAATFAYRGATAKVRDDRDVRETNL